jgi:hypothetical protein
MDPKTQVVAILGSLFVLGLVIELVRRRKLKEEYSVLWVLTALVLLVLSVWYGLLELITRSIGAVSTPSTLFFFGLVFALLMLLHFSTRISSLERRVTMLVQEIGLMSARERLDDRPVEHDDTDSDDPAPAGSRPAGNVRLHAAKRSA